jgi:hypothetical protein
MSFVGTVIVSSLVYRNKSARVRGPNVRSIFRNDRPAAGINAANSLRGTFGTSQWQLYFKAISFPRRRKGFAPTICCRA